MPPFNLRYPFMIRQQARLLGPESYVRATSKRRLEVRDDVFGRWQLFPTMSIDMVAAIID